MADETLLPVDEGLFGKTSRQHQPSENGEL
jgi:hypothetical protein